MIIKCPNTHCLNHSTSGKRINLFYKKGLFYRSSDRKHVQRYCCRVCFKSFSSATFSVNFNQKKRQLNHKISRLLVSGVSQRECHRILKINKKTVVRKFLFMAEIARVKIEKLNQEKSKVTTLQFDDMESFEHTKLKPLSITLAVEEDSRHILGFQVSSMPAKGHLAAKSLKKYGKRKDERSKSRKLLFKSMAPYIEHGCLIKSDENPHYVKDVKSFFKGSEHCRYKGGRGCIVGQGELKKLGFDPLFSLNHTCATLRAKVNRLFRRTWCTTKKKERLTLHLNLVVLHHNLNLKPPLHYPQ